MKQNETSKPCRDHEIDRAFGSRDTSRVAIQPEDGIVALAEWEITCSLLFGDSRDRVYIDYRASPSSRVRCIG